MPIELTPRCEDLTGRADERLSGATRIPDLRNALESLVTDPAGLRRWLGAHRDRAAEISRESYWHTNGFAKLVLHVGEQFRIRLHVWPPGEHRAGETDPHSHRWDFVSTVLVGDGLEIAEWAEDGAAARTAFFRYDYDGSSLAPHGTVDLGVVREHVVRRSEVYATDRSVVHTVRPRGDHLVATLLVQGPQLSPSTTVFRENVVDPVTGPASEDPIDPEQVADLLDQVATSIPPVPPTLRDLGERRILSDLLAPRYRDVDAYGDDCASLPGDLVVTTDSCTEALVSAFGDDPYATGWLLVVMNLSDLAAAGADAEGLVVNYTLPSDTPVAWFEELVRGVDECAAAHETTVRGGDIRDGPVRLLTATAVGRCRRRDTADGPVSTRLSRHGAQAGDKLVLVGSPGFLWASALTHRLELPLPRADRSHLHARAACPHAKLAAGGRLADAGLARASMDVSDGLFPAVHTLARVNGLGAVVCPEIDLDPVVAWVAKEAGVSSLALGQMWGDWNLLVAVAPEDVATVLEMGVEAQVIGTMVADPEVRVDGRPGPWQGIDQERFSSRSWPGRGIDAMIDTLRTLSGQPGREQC